MKKVANILFIVAAAMGILCALIFVALSITFLILAAPQNAQLIVDGLNNGTIHTDLPGTPEEQALAIQVIFGTIGGMFIFFFVTCAVSVFIAFKCRNCRSKGLFIAAIVVGCFSTEAFLIVPAVFGLIKGDTVE